jgi:hypothetical protein
MMNKIKNYKVKVLFMKYQIEIVIFVMQTQQVYNSLTI